MLHKWSEATDTSGSYVRVLFLNFSKSFDLVNHNILSAKLKCIGVPALLLRWVGAFLINRTQRVKIGNTFSLTGKPNGGVPQGPISGPKFYLLHINDLVTPSPINKYVDDCTIFKICQHRCSTSPLQESADVAIKWMVAG